MTVRLNNVEVTAPDGTKHAELLEYVKRMKEKYPKLEALKVTFEGDEALLECHLTRIPFERIRRITGYLVGAMPRWNDAKRAEEHDRVKHTL